MIPAGLAVINVPWAMPRWCAPARDPRPKLPVFQPQPGPLAAISEGLRRQFDPKGILNPGLMG